MQPLECPRFDTPVTLCYNPGTMHIGIDASRAARAQRTGTEGYSLQLIRALMALDADDEFTLYFNQTPPPGLLPGAPNFHSLAFPMPRLWTHLALSAQMSRQPPDVLLVPAHVLPIVHPPRSVVTVHDLGYLKWPTSHRAFDRWYLDLSNRYHARAATRLLAISQATRDDLIQCYGVPAGRITVTQLAADESFRPAGPADVDAVRRRYSLAGRYLLYVGTLQPRKNLPRLVRAFASIAGDRPDLQLVLVGKQGWMYEALRSEVGRLGVENRVLFTGYAPAEDLPALYTGALAFAFPSLYEGFGMPALEAMSCGAPVVASNVSSLPEVVGDAGILVDPTDETALAAALTRMADSADLRADLRARGLARARLFSWERCARETLEALRQATA